MCANYSRFKFITPGSDFGTAHAGGVSPITKQQPTNYDYQINITLISPSNGNGIFTRRR